MGAFSVNSTDSRKIMFEICTLLCCVFHTFTRSNVILLRGKLVVLSQDGYIIYFYLLCLWLSFITGIWTWSMSYYWSYGSKCYSNITYTVITSSIWAGCHPGFASLACMCLPCGAPPTVTVTSRFCFCRGSLSTFTWVNHSYIRKQTHTHIYIYLYTYCIYWYNYKYTQTHCASLHWQGHGHDNGNGNHVQEHAKRPTNSIYDGAWIRI